MTKRDRNIIIRWALFLLVFFLALVYVSRAHAQEVNPVAHTQATWDASEKTGRWVQFDGFTQTHAYEFRRFTQFLLGEEATTLELHLSNGGGALFPTLSMIDDLRLLQKSGVEIVSYATGMCASACAMLWSYGDTRIIGASSWLMFHSLAITTTGTNRQTLHDLEAQATLLRRVQNRINADIAGRLGLSHEEIAEIMSTDTWMTAEEALTRGIATDIL